MNVYLGYFAHAFHSQTSPQESKLQPSPVHSIHVLHYVMLYETTETNRVWKHPIIRPKCACAIAERQNKAPPLHFEAYSACRPYICFIQLKPFSSLIITQGHIVIHILINGLSSKDEEGHVEKCLRLSKTLNLYTYNLARLVFAWFTV